MLKEKLDKEYPLVSEYINYSNMMMALYIPKKVILKYDINMIVATMNTVDIFREVAIKKCDHYLDKMKEYETILLRMEEDDEEFQFAIMGRQDNYESAILYMKKVELYNKQANILKLICEAFLDKKDTHWEEELDRFNSNLII